MDATPPPPSAAGRRKRVLLTLPLVVIALVIWFFVGKGNAPPAQVHYVLGSDSAQVRNLEVRWRRSDGTGRVHEVRLQFPGGAPADLYREEHVRPGSHTVEAQLRGEGAETARHITRTVNVVAEQPVEVDLRP